MRWSWPQKIACVWIIRQLWIIVWIRETWIHYKEASTIVNEAPWDLILLEGTTHFMDFLGLGDAFGFLRNVEMWAQCFGLHKRCLFLYRNAMENCGFMLFDPGAELWSRWVFNKICLNATQWSLVSLLSDELLWWQWDSDGKPCPLSLADISCPKRLKGHPQNRSHIPLEMAPPCLRYPKQDLLVIERLKKRFMNCMQAILRQTS